MRQIDNVDKKILDSLQDDCTVPVAELAANVGLTATPCWRRVQRLEEDGVIRKRVALLDPGKVNVGVTVFVTIRTSHHDMKWLRSFTALVTAIPEVVEFYRMSGQADYLLRIVVPDIAAYDRVYKQLINGTDLSDVTSSFAMEQIKYTTRLPLHHAVA